MAVAAVPVEEDLEALFDSLSASRQREISAMHPAPSSVPNDQSKSASRMGVTELPQVTADTPDMYKKIGTLTRQLHEALRELGLDKTIEAAANEIPNARDRLGYIAKLTGQAAERALAAVEVGQAEQESLRDQATKLSEQWERFFGGAMSIEEFRSLAHASRGFMLQARSRAEATQNQLMEIMMAQDFHDLTGQVINRLSSLVQKMECDMLNVLLETTPADRRPTSLPQQLEGPQVNAERRTDIVTSQSQVDDLLDSLGF